MELETEITCTHFENELGIYCSEFRNVPYDLTKYFDRVILERKHDRFTPDVTLKSSRSDEVIYIEIAVTHKSSEDKIRSGHRIIEFLIESEEDTSALKSTVVNKYNQLVKLHNFIAKPIRMDVCSGNCQNEFSCFIIDYKGMASVIKSTPENIIKKINSKSVIRSSLYKSNNKIQNEFYNFVKKANIDGIHLRSCYVCDNIEYEENNDKLFCRKNFKIVPSNEAYRCSSFIISKRFL